LVPYRFTSEESYTILARMGYASAESFAAETGLDYATARRRLRILDEEGWATSTKVGRFRLYTPVTPRPARKPRVRQQGRTKLPTVRVCGGRLKISRARYNELVMNRPDECQCCGRGGKTLHLDHDHETGQIRGWICLSCNVGLGHFADNPARLERAIDYLCDPPLSP
jgi:hypothetical protein